MYTMHYRRIRIYVFIICIGILTLTCKTKDNEDPSANRYAYHTPEQVEDGWTVTSANDVGLDINRLINMMNYINSSDYHNIHSILIFKDNFLVFEEYFDGYEFSWNPPGSNGDWIQYDRQVDHYLASVSKSITSVILGAAVLHGFIDNLNDKIVDLLPEYNYILTGGKENITLYHLLTMSSGLDWDEITDTDDNSRNDAVQIYLVDDPIEYILSLPLVYTPGQEFLYNSGGTNVLGAIVQKCTGISLLDFSNTFLFEPLNVEGGSWYALGENYVLASGGLFLRPRELAKIGYLFLNDGQWGAHQIISEQWINESISNHISTQGRTLPLAYGYGYQWWLQNYHINGSVHRSFLAAGWGDQYMIIFPEQDMMILFNGGNYFSSGSISPFELVEDYILRSL